MYGEQFQKWLAGGIGVNVFLEMDPEEAIAKEFDCEGVQRRKQKLDLSYVLHHNYPPNLLKDKKRAVRKRAATLVVDKGKVFLKRKGHLVKVASLFKLLLLNFAVCCQSCLCEMGGVC